MDVNAVSGVQLCRKTDDSVQHCGINEKKVQLDKVAAVNMCNENTQSQFPMKQNLTSNQSSLESLPKVKIPGDKRCIGNLSSGNSEADKSGINCLEIKSSVRHLPLHGRPVLTADKILLSHSDKNKLMNLEMEPIQAAATDTRREMAHFLSDIHGMPSKTQSFPAEDGRSEGRPVKDRMLSTSEAVKQQAVKGDNNTSTATEVKLTEFIEPVERNTVAAMPCRPAPQQSGGRKIVSEVSNVQPATSTEQFQKGGIVIQSNYKILTFLVFMW